MKYKIITDFSITILTVFLFISCTKNDSNSGQPIPEIFEYPLKSGNSWNYHKKVVIEYLDTTNINIITEKDSIELDYMVQNLDKEPIKDSIEAYKLLSTNLSNGVISIEYCNNTSQGLFSYAYNLKEGSIPFAKGKVNLKYCSIPLFSNELGTLKQTFSDSLNYENPPAKIIAYPIVYNTKWTLRTNNQTTVYKEITEKENLIINQNTYSCYKIKYTYSNNLYNNIDFVDYVSTVGLVKRSETVKNIAVLDVTGQPTNKKCNYKEEIILKSYILH